MVSHPVISPVSYILINSKAAFHSFPLFPLFLVSSVWFPPGHAKILAMRQGIWAATFRPSQKVLHLLLLRRKTSRSRFETMLLEQPAKCHNRRRQALSNYHHNIDVPVHAIGWGYVRKFSWRQINVSMDHKNENLLHFASQLHQD